jgi:hypothetical protein
VSRGEHGSVWVGFRRYLKPDPRGASLKKFNPHVSIATRRVSGLRAGRVCMRVGFKSEFLLGFVLRLS